MQRSELMQRLEQLIPEIQRTKDASGTLLKFARAHNLSPAQLEALAQVYNTGKALTFYSKSANRGDTFSLVETEPLLEEFTTHAPVKEAAVVKSASDDTVLSRFPFYHQVEDSQELEKAASVETEVKSLQCALIAARWDRAATKAASEMVDEAIDETKDSARGLMEDIRESVRFNKQAFSTLEMEAIALLGDAVKPVMDKVASYLASTHCDVSAHRGYGLEVPPLVRDSTGLVSKVAAISDALSFIRAGNSYKTELLKAGGSSVLDLMDPAEKQQLLDQEEWLQGLEASARKKMKAQQEEDSRKTQQGDTAGEEGAQVGSQGSGATPPSLEPQRGPRRPTRPDEGTPSPQVLRTLRVDYPDDPVGGGGGGGGGGGDAVLDALLKGIDTPLLARSEGKIKRPLQEGMKVVEMLGSGKNTRQQKRDKAVQEDTGVASLQRLLMSDPVLAEADPAEVMNHYNTINEIAPAIAADPAKLRLPLRDAVQYGSIPMHTLKELLEINKLLASNSEQMAKNDSAAYEVKPRNPFSQK